jgi:hypothetical protein
LPDTVIPSQREKIERWNLRTDQVPEGMADQLADEALRMLIDDYSQQGKPQPDPDQLTKLVAAKVNAVLYPYRQEVYGRGTPRPDARVREAERFKRLSEKQMMSGEDRYSRPAGPEQPAPTPAPEQGGGSY